MKQPRGQQKLYKFGPRGSNCLRKHVVNNRIEHVVNTRNTWFTRGYNCLTFTYVLFGQTEVDDMDDFVLFLRRPPDQEVLRLDIPVKR